MTPDTRIEIPAHVVARELVDETVLLNLETGIYYGLDDVGVRMWDLLGQGLSLAEVCDTITAEYDVDRAVAESDLSELCGNLLEQNLISARS